MAIVTKRLACGLSGVARKTVAWSVEIRKPRSLINVTGVVQKASHPPGPISPTMANAWIGKPSRAGGLGRQADLPVERNWIGDGQKCHLGHALTEMGLYVSPGSSSLKLERGSGGTLLMASCQETSFLCAKPWRGSGALRHGESLVA